MEQLVYVAVILNGVTLVSPEAIPIDKCDTLRKYNTSILFMCIDEDQCGRSPGLRRCPDDPLPNRKYARKR